MTQLKTKIMKQYLKLMIVIFLMTVSAVAFSQAGIYMFSPNLPGEISGGIHNGETPITSLSRSYDMTPNGQATNGGLTILKPYNRPSINLKDALWRTTNLHKLELRYYNSNNQMYYKITLGGVNNAPYVFVESIIESAEVCPSGCPGVAEQIKFNFKQVEERDLLAVPQIARCWNFALNNSQCAN
jgi:type VI protein secretion system component Hcp